MINSLKIIDFKWIMKKPKINSEIVDWFNRISEMYDAIVQRDDEIFEIPERRA